MTKASGKLIMMKTQISNYGFEVLITYLLPGIIAVIAVAIAHGVGFEQMKALLTWATEAEFLSAFLGLASIALLGAIIATVQAIIETYILDKITPRLLGISNAVFCQEWDDYLKALPTEKNSYISRVVLFFQFETRMGLALLLLGGILFKLSWAHAITAIAMGVVLYLVGIAHHRELASYRHKQFSQA